MFEGAGWQVLSVKYGRLLQALFAEPGGDALRRRIDDMSNPEYQRLLRYSVDDLPAHLPGTGAESVALGELVCRTDPHTVFAALRNLGGHDLAALGGAFDAIDDTRPTVIFAYTGKGHALPSEGHPQNHSVLLTGEQLAELASRLGVDAARPWARFADDTAEGRLCGLVGARLHRDPIPSGPGFGVPADLGRTPGGVNNTQAALGRALLDINRAAPDVGARVVTVSPDVSSSTNLGGWINKVGIWSHAERADWFADDGETLLHWREQPSGRHIELGIAETNLVGLLGELGATWSRWGRPLLPIGVLYDPFLERALEPWSFGIYAGGQSIVVGTPSGVTLAPEGGAHQSITTPSLGIEQPGCIGYEPAFALDVEWTLLASLARLGRPDGGSGYLRLSTRPVDQTLAAVPADPAARERRRRQVIAGAYLLHRNEKPRVTLAAMGAVVPEALAAADRLAETGVAADVVSVTSPGLLFDALLARQGRSDAPTWILDQAFPAARATPIVTVLDGHPHTLAFLATVNGVPGAALGVTRFGQSGSLEDVYRYHGIDADSILRAALDVLDQG
jgi:pyruvate dehydrogenase E1 component